MTVEVTYAAPHHLVADTFHNLRPTRAGDAWTARHSQPAPSPGVPLGMPTLGPKPLEPATTACGLP